MTLQYLIRKVPDINGEKPWVIAEIHPTEYLIVSNHANGLEALKEFAKQSASVAPQPASHR